MPYRVTRDCTQCNVCIAGCESNAIRQGKDANLIDVTLCTECGLCADNCPFQAIVFEKEAVLEESKA